MFILLQKNKTMISFCLVLFLVIFNSTVANTENTVVVILGCAMPSIQKDRVDHALKNLPDKDFIMFLTGGIKNEIINYQESEASVMANSFNTEQYKIIIDENAKNTAENFVNLKKWILLNKNIKNIIITTSAFHHNRASKIFNGIFYDIKINVTWILASASCSTCWDDEKIHINNVEKDVQNALALAFI